MTKHFTVDLSKLRWFIPYYRYWTLDTRDNEYKLVEVKKEPKLQYKSTDKWRDIPVVEDEYIPPKPDGYF